MRRQTAAWVAAAGLFVLVVSTILALSWRNELPDPVASHWGVDGTANGFSSFNAIMAVMLGFGIALVAGLGAVTLWLGHAAVIRRICAAATVWAALFISILTLGTLYIQRGLTDAHDVGGVGAVMLVAVAGSLLPAVIVGILIPGDPPLPTTDAVARDAPRTTLADGERTTWTGRAQAVPAIGAGVLVLVGLLALVIVIRLWALLIVVGLVGFLVLSMLQWVVRIDVTGLTIRSTLGWPRIRVPLNEVVRADVIDVRPLRDFGGWGLRVGRGGRLGIVLGKGKALLVQRTGDRSIAVTIADANDAAATLNTLADQARRA